MCGKSMAFHAILYLKEWWVAQTRFEKPRSVAQWIKSGESAAIEISDPAPADHCTTNTTAEQHIDQLGRRFFSWFDFFQCSFNSFHGNYFHIWLNLTQLLIRSFI